MDILFVIPNSSKEAYQSLSEHYSAIEPPTWALLLASSLKKSKFSCEILDANALRLDTTKTVSEIKDRKPRVTCFVLYGQNPNAGTTSSNHTIEEGDSLCFDFGYYDPSSPPDQLTLTASGQIFDQNIKGSLLDVSGVWFSTGSFTLELGLYIDKITSIMLMVVSLISFLVHLYSTEYMKGDPRYSRYFAFLGLFTFSMNGIVLSNSLIIEEDK